MARRVLGALFLCTGVLFLSWSLDASQTLRTHVSHFVEMTDPAARAVWLTLAGSLAAFLGALLIFAGDRRPRI